MKYHLQHDQVSKSLIDQAVGDSALSTFAQNCANIERLNLQTCKKLSDRTCQSLSRHCTKLQFLDISSCSNLTDNSLRAIGHGCSMVRLADSYIAKFTTPLILQLTSLNISWCEMITAAGVGAVAEGCRKLKTFISKVLWKASYWGSDKSTTFHTFSGLSSCRR